MSAANTILMPKLGLTMTEGFVASWNAKVGDTVAQGDVLFVVETDKIATDVPADADFVIDAILVPEGETAEVGAVVATFVPSGAARPASAPMADKSPAPAPPPPPAATPARASRDSRVTADPAERGGSTRILATPLARRIARQDGIDLAQIAGSGPRGRIKAIDLACAARGATVQDAPAPAPAAPPDSSSRKPTSIERTIAARLTAAKLSMPHFYVMADADITDLLALRSTLNQDDRFPKVTVNHLLLLAMARALASMPEFNTVWTDDAIVTLGTIDVGLAVETQRGLLAPVIRDVGGQSLSELVRRANDTVDLARSGKAGSDSLSGGALTLSNVGMFGATYLIPIVNPGQSAILGAGGNKPVFRPDANGAPVLRQEIGLTLSCDHRVHDGARAARFLTRLIHEPAALGYFGFGGSVAA